MDEKRMGEMAVVFLRDSVKKKDVFVTKSLTEWMHQQFRDVGLVQDPPFSLREIAEFTKAIIG